MKISDKIEQAGEVSRELFIEAYGKAFGLNPCLETGLSTQARGDRFLELLNVEAWLEAAMMLVPKGSLWSVADMEEGPNASVLWPHADGSYTGNYVRTEAATPALALCAAALRARGL